MSEILQTLSLTHFEKALFFNNPIHGQEAPRYSFPRSSVGMRSLTLCVRCFRGPDDAERRDGIPTGDRGNECEC